MKNSVMIDLETFGRRPGCIVPSIGAVKFTSDGATDSLYLVLDTAEQEDRGLCCEVDTVKWWLQQSTEAQKALLLTPESVPAGLQRLAAFIGDSYVWANGASFDFPILAELYRRFDMGTPWKFWDERDFRTVKQLVNVATERVTTAHHALADAEYQTRVLLAIAREVPAIKALLEA